LTVGATAVIVNFVAIIAGFALRDITITTVADTGLANAFTHPALFDSTAVGATPIVSLCVRVVTGLAAEQQTIATNGRASFSAVGANPTWLFLTALAAAIAGLLIPIVAGFIVCKKGIAAIENTELASGGAFITIFNDTGIGTTIVVGQVAIITLFANVDAATTTGFIALGRASRTGPATFDLARRISTAITTILFAVIAFFIASDMSIAANRKARSPFQWAIPAKSLKSAKVGAAITKGNISIVAIFERVFDTITAGWIGTGPGSAFIFFIAVVSAIITLFITALHTVTTCIDKKLTILVATITRI
jgi:hypothetical protein